MFGYRAQGDFATVTGAVQHVVLDPALPMVLGRIQTLHDLEQTKPSSGQPSPPEKPGIGLHRLVRPLDFYIAYRRNPWILPVALVSIVGGLIGLGYLLGEK